jgi:probable HAF family extracellular repeat protein
MWRDGKIQDLGVPALLGSIQISEQGEVIAGRFLPLASPLSYLWSNGVLTELPLFASAINRFGLIAGHTWDGDGKRRAATWRRGRLEELPTLGGDTFVTGLSDAGHISGVSFDSAGVSHAVMWRGGQITDLGIPAGVKSTTTGINIRGQVLGSGIGTDTRENRAFIWSGSGEPLALGDLGFHRTLPAHINDEGVVIGRGTTSSFSMLRAFIWKDGIFTNLGAGTGGYSLANKVNRNGIVVGLSERGASNANTPAMWVPNP